MNSTASSIDRGTSNLRTHQILALLTHLITHKYTISGASSTNRADLGKKNSSKCHLGSFVCGFVWSVYMISTFTCQTLYKILTRIVKGPIIE